MNEWNVCVYYQKDRSQAYGSQHGASGNGGLNYHLSEAYDIFPVNVVLKSDPDQMALTVHGKKRNIHRNDFLALAQNCGISRKAAENMIRSILKKGQSQELWDFKSHPRVIPRTRAPQRC